MMQPGNRTGFWRSVRELPERTPLRVKLITAVLALVAVALLVISVTGLGFLKSYLLGPINNQLYAAAAAPSLPGVVQESLQSGRPVGTPTANVIVDWNPTGGKPQQISRAVSGGVFMRGVGTPPGPQVTPGAEWLTSGRPTTVSAASGPGRWQVISVPVTTARGHVTGYVIIGLNVTSVYQTTGRLIAVDWIVSVLLLLVLAVVGVGVVRASLRPLKDIEQTAGAIAAGDLSERVPERDPRTEVGRLGRSLNAMLSQIESAFRSRSRSEAAARRSEEKMRQFVADASHELRTPLTAIRGFAEYYRQRGGIASGSDTHSGQLAPGDMDRIMRRVEQESARMGILVEDMLLLARLDQQRPLDARPVDLLTLAADAVHDARVVAPSRSIQLTVGAGAALLVIGDEVRLRQVIGNLMSNALTHTPDGTPIAVLIRSGDLNEAATATEMARPDRDDEPGSEELASHTPEASHSPEAWDGASWDAEHVPPPPEPLDPADSPLSGPAAVLEVTDHGAGLRPEQAEHVFERFYRADPSRTTGGTGLGLAIVAALISAHGGAAWVKSRPGEGATFSVALPLAPEAVPGAEDDHEDAPEAGGATDWNGLAGDTGQAAQNGGPTRTATR